MYLQGFGNYHQTEAIEGALPTEQNSPQKCPLGLYAEQISGSAFTQPRHSNLHSWLYRILPTAAQGAYEPYELSITQDYCADNSPNALRWSPFFDSASNKCNFIGGLLHIAGTSCAQTYLYHCTLSMEEEYFANNDGEMLFVPYQGALNLHTEMGKLSIKPGMIAVIPRGIKFKVELVEEQAKGYVCENSASPLTLPQLGVVGANGLANPRHFNYPTAAFEETNQTTTIICKNQNTLWQSHCQHSPLNVVAWGGNYAPYSYDLSLFNTLNTVSFDHPDPSIFTVLTSQSNTPGVANLDFVIFPSRWMVAEHTFRPPYFHRNIMSELMGLIYGEYDAKKEGFSPGGVSIHNCMGAHGPDVRTYNQAIKQDLKPQKYRNTLAFMFETKDRWQVTEQAMKHPARQQNYLACWDGFERSLVSK